MCQSSLMPISDKKDIINKPRWLKVPLPKGGNYTKLQTELKSRGLATVCQEAKCPNIGECWSAQTATVMILGDTCTRACKFCHVKTGNPAGFIDQNEIKHTVEMVAMMALRYIVITSVDRDDLEDGGAEHFANIIKAVHENHPTTKVEVLIPDFDGKPTSMNKIGEANPFVIAQNIETVKRLTHPVRDRRAGYDQTLNALKYYKEHFAHIATKSSIMVGLGESIEEIKQTCIDLRNVGVNIVTFGQYLQPSLRHLKVDRYYKPVEFDDLKNMAYELGFDFVASGPMVRSSYKAADYFDWLESRGN